MELISELMVCLIKVMYGLGANAVRVECVM